MVDEPTSLQVLWERHSGAEWPRFTSPHQGELMTLDTVIAGCVTYVLDTPSGLDAQRQSILESCLTDLHALLPDLPEDAQAYFSQLLYLGTRLHQTTKEQTG